MYPLVRFDCLKLRYLLKGHKNLFLFSLYHTIITIVNTFLNENRKGLSH